MVSRTCSGTFSSMKSMMKILWYGNWWNSVCRTSWSCSNTPATIPSTCKANKTCHYTKPYQELITPWDKPQAQLQGQRLCLRLLYTLSTFSGISCKNGLMCEGKCSGGSYLTDTAIINCKTATLYVTKCSLLCCLESDSHGTDNFRQYFNSPQNIFSCQRHMINKRFQNDIKASLIMWKSYFYQIL